MVLKLSDAGTAQDVASASAKPDAVQFMVGYHGAWIRVDNKLRFLSENSNERPVGVVGHRIGATAAGIEVLRMRMDPKVLDTMPEEALTQWGIERAADTA